LNDLIEDNDIKFSNKNKQLDKEQYMKKYQELISIFDEYSKLNTIPEQNTADYYKMFEVEIILEY
jgi:hypothetical protein